MVGRYSSEEMLPGERDLATSMAVSRTTLRRLVTDLVAEGLLRHRQGVGTFVQREPGAAGPPVAAASEPRTPRLLGFAEEMAARGLLVTTQDLACATVLPTPEEAMMLACSPGEPVIRLRRLRWLNGQALAIELATIPLRLVVDPGRLGPSLYANLEERGCPPVRALQRLQATLVEEAEAGELHVAPGTAGLSVRRTAYGATGVCCEFTRSIYPGALYDAVTESFARGKLESEQAPASP